LANTQSAIKRVRSNQRKQQRNRIVVSRTRTALTAARASLEGTDVAAAREAARVAIKQLDKAAEKGVIHKNAASRRKSRLMKRLNAMATQATE
jgi:small subunit ribosomal protein S20